MAPSDPRIAEVINRFVADIVVMVRQRAEDVIGSFSVQTRGTRGASPTRSGTSAKRAPQRKSRQPRKVQQELGLETEATPNIERLRKTKADAPKSKRPKRGAKKRAEQLTLF